MQNLFKLQLLLQSDNLVAILCSLQEIEFLGSIFHQTSSLGNALLQLGTCHALDDRIGSKGGLSASNTERGTLQLFGIAGVSRCQRDVQRLLDLRRCDAVLFIVFQLLGASAQGLIDGELHGDGDGISIHDDLAVDVTCSTASRLCQTAMATKESLFIRIEDGHQRHFWQVEALAQQVHAHQHIVSAVAQVLENFYTVQCCHLAVDVGCLHTVI